MARERLPNRRASENFDFEAMDLKFTASFSRYEDGRVAEVFINARKPGGTLDTLVYDLGIAVSFALQFGADADAIRRAASRDSAGRALGPLGVTLDRILQSEAQSKVQSKHEKQP